MSADKHSKPHPVYANRTRNRARDFWRGVADKMGAPMKAKTKRPKVALLLAGIALLIGCAKDEKYEVLSATQEVRKGDTDDKDVTVFKLRHGRTIITGSCQQYVKNVEMKCAELVVGDRYAVKRYRHNSVDMLLLEFPQKKNDGVVLSVEAESVQ